MSKRSRFCRKIHGSYFAFLGVGIATISTIISMISLLSVYPNINLFSLWMSDLGASPFGVFFNISIMISSIFLFLFIRDFLKFLSEHSENQGLIRITLMFGFFSSLGLFLIGFFPVRTIGEATIIHSTAAFMYWIGSFLFWLFLGIIELKNPKISTNQSVMAIITCLFWSFFLVYLMLIPLFPILDTSKFPQWLVHIVLVISLTEHGIYFLKQDR
jgi:hypothetical protein